VDPLDWRRIGGICGGICYGAIFFVLLLINIGTTSAAVAVTDVTNPINCLLCRILTILWGIVAAIATFVIVLAGLKWIGSADDPGGRAQAKATIVHAIIGLIIVTVAMQVVAWAVQGTVAGSIHGYTFDPRDFLPAPAGNGCSTLCT